MSSIKAPRSLLRRKISVVSALTMFVFNVFAASDDCNMDMAKRCQGMSVGGSVCQRENCECQFSLVEEYCHTLCKCTEMVEFKKIQEDIKKNRGN